MRRPWTCPGFDEPCDKPLDESTAWTVQGTIHRDEWQACERCAMHALRWASPSVDDPAGRTYTDVQEMP